MAWGPITSWQTDEEKMETTKFLFLGYKIPAMKLEILPNFFLAGKLQQT